MATHQQEVLRTVHSALAFAKTNNAALEIWRRYMGAVCPMESWFPSILAAFVSDYHHDGGNAFFISHWLSNGSQLQTQTTCSEMISKHTQKLDFRSPHVLNGMEVSYDRQSDTVKVSVTGCELGSGKKHDNEVLLCLSRQELARNAASGAYGASAHECPECMPRTGWPVCNPD